MKKDKMFYGAGESTGVVDPATKGTAFDATADVSVGKINGLLKDTSAIRFGKGETDETYAAFSQIVALTDDNKMRLVWHEEEGTATGSRDPQSGAVFVGNKLVSSRILDIKVDGNDGYVTADYDADGNATYVKSDFKRAEKVTIKWFGFGHDNRNADGSKLAVAPVDFMGIHTTTFEILDPDVINKRLAQLDERVDDIEAHLMDADNLTVADGAALTVTPGKKAVKEVTELQLVDGELVEAKKKIEFATWQVAVNVDDDTVQIVKEGEGAAAKNVLKVATYSLDKVSDATATDVEKGAAVDNQFAAQYQLVMTDPTGKKVAVGDTINIMKDFLLKEASVCTFDRFDSNGAKITWGVEGNFELADGQKTAYTATKADADKEGRVTFGSLVDDGYPVRPWALHTDGTYELAPVGKGVKWGHTYLHLVLNTINNDEKTVIPDASKDGTSSKNDMTTDVYLDFTDIFHTFSADEKYIHLDQAIGKFSLDEANVTDMVDNLLEKNHTKAGYKRTSEHIQAIDASIAALETSTNNIEASYVKVSSIAQPKSEGSQFNEVTITNATRVEQADGSFKIETADVKFDIANEAFYTALNAALAALKANDTQLATLLTWETLDN